jgi:hypothetical protein
MRNEIEARAVPVVRESPKILAPFFHPVSALMESDGDWRIGSQGQGMHWVDTPEVAVAAKWAASVVDASRYME